MVSKLPVLAASWQTFKEVGKKWKMLAKALALPTIMFALLNAIILQVPSTPSMFLIQLLVRTLIGTVFAVSCHRIAIIGANSLPNSYGVFWRARETMFLSWSIGFGLVGFMVAVAFAALVGDSYIAFVEAFPVAGAVLTPTTLLLIAYLLARVGMVFPATALDRRSSLVSSWTLTSGQGVRVLVATTIPPLLVALIVGLISGLVEATGIVLIAMITIFGSVLFAVSVISISVVYRFLVSIRDGSASAA